MGLGFNSTLPYGRLPETDVEGMRQFLATLIVPRVHKSFLIQIYVGAGTIFILALLMIMIAIRRLNRSSAWLLQFHTTPLGTYVLPNAVMALVFFLFIYAVVFTAHCFVVVDHYKSGAHQRNFLIFHQSPWSALWAGAWFCGLGAVSAFPDALRQRGHGTLQRVFLRPSVFNFMALAGPGACFGTSLIPAIIGNRIYNEVVPRHRGWLIKSSDSSISSSQLATEAREIWLQVTEAYYWDSITFGVWFAWGVILFVVFTSIATHTLLRVRAQVKLAKRKKHDLESISPTFYLFSSRLNYERSGTQHSRMAVQAQQAGARELAFDGLGTLDSQFVMLEEQRTELRQFSEPLTQLVEAEHCDTATVLFPALKSRPGERLTRGQAAAKRSSVLKLVYRNVLVQYAAIGIGTASFSGMALYVACASYPASRANNLGIHHEIQMLLATYGSCIFGAFIMGAVIWRSFDPAFLLSPEQTEETELPQSGVTKKMVSAPAKFSRAFASVDDGSHAVPVPRHNEEPKWEQDISASASAPERAIIANFGRFQYAARREG